MPETFTPAPVRQFILSSIPSVPYLEAVPLLRNEPVTPWDARGATTRPNRPSYLGRLVSYGLILFAIWHKNRPRR